MHEPLDPASVVQSVHADLEKERREEERKRALVRAHRNKPIALPRDERSKEIYAQKYRLRQERTAFIQERHRDFYLAQIVERYPTPRFPYLDQRNVALWMPEGEEARRNLERIMPEARKRIQEETMRRIVKQEAADAAKRSKLKEEEATKVVAPAAATSSRGGGSKKRQSKKKQLPISAAAAADAAAAAESAAAASSHHHHTPSHKPAVARQTQNSLNDSFALEQALLLSTADAPMAEEPAPAAAAAETKSEQSTAAAMEDQGAAASSSSSSSSSASPILPSLSSLSFARTTPLLRPGSFILLDNPDLEDWEAARIVSVNKARTRILIEPEIVAKPSSAAAAASSSASSSAAASAASAAAAAGEDAGGVAGSASAGADSSRPAPYFFSPTSAPSSRARWIDLDSAHFFEYIDVIWAKLKGFDWWPAELVEEVEFGTLIHPSSSAPGGGKLLHICFCEDTRTIQTISSSAIQPYNEHRDQYCTAAKLKRKGFEESMQAADEVWNNHLWQSILEEHERRLAESDFLHRLLADHPTFFFGKRVATYWPLDETWYSGVIKQYNLHTRKHCILYNDDAVEWIDLQKEKIVFAPFMLAVGHDGELPTDPAILKQLYKTYQHQSYQLHTSTAKTGTVNVLKDFLPDYVPRIVEQVHPIPAVDPCKKKLIPKSTETAVVPSSAAASAAASAVAASAASSSSSSSSPAMTIDLKSIACWECGLDLERWNGPGLLSAKYGGSSKQQPPVDVISCGRCTKVVHSFCLNLMLKRKNQTERAALPASSSSVEGSASSSSSSALVSAAGGNDEAAAAEAGEGEQVLPPHLSSSIANPRCPDCLRCEHCQLISNKLGRVEDMVTCDVCQVRVHLQCTDPPFDPAIHQRPDDGGWVCTLCVKCRCCGATHSRGGHSQLPPLPPPPACCNGSNNSSNHNAIAIAGSTPTEEALIEEAQSALAATAPSSSPLTLLPSSPANVAAAMDIDGSQSPFADAPSASTSTPTASAPSSQSTTAAAASPVDAMCDTSTRDETVPSGSSSSSNNDVTVGAGARTDLVTPGTTATATATATATVTVTATAVPAATAAPVEVTLATFVGPAPSSASGASKRKKTSSRKKPSSQNSRSKTTNGGAAAAAAQDDKPARPLPFSKRFISNWVDTDEELSDTERAAAAEAAGSKAKRPKLESGSKALVTFTLGKKNDSSDNNAALVESSGGPDKSFWQWTNAFTVCQPCGYRLTKRKFCPICVRIYDNHTRDPMVQCDSCQRWVHIACDPNAQANESKLIKDNTLYHW